MSEGGFIGALTRLFPLWAVLLSVAAFLYPEVFTPLKSAIVPLLGVVMFGMGITLSPRDFREVARRPALVGLGTFLQFFLMPLFGWAVAKAFQLDPVLAAGLILVGSCPGGTASNVITYLARGDVALSITLTSVSTLLAVAVTPTLTWLYAGTLVPVPVWDMLLSILEVVLIPVTLGVAVNTWFGARLHAVKRAFPLLSVAAIVAIIAIIVALNRNQIQGMAVTVALSVMAHNLLGLAGGYWIPRAFGYGERECRTLAVEVGMQNSGLGVALAIQYFSPAAALPGALFSVWHNLSGSFLAAWWAGRRRSAPQP